MEKNQNALTYELLDLSLQNYYNRSFKNKLNLPEKVQSAKSELHPLGIIFSNLHLSTTSYYLLGTN